MPVTKRCLLCTASRSRSLLQWMRSAATPSKRTNRKFLQTRVSGLGLVPANYDPKTGTVSYQVPQKLRDKSCTVIVSAKSAGKKVETHWTFGIEESAATAAGSPAAKK